MKNKKSVYDTVEMEKEALNQELEDLKRVHTKECEHLNKNAVKMTLEEIRRAKNSISELDKAKTSVIRKIARLRPALFD